MKFPLIGSMSLVGLFLAIKFLPKQWLNYIITTYFCVMGVFALGGVYKLPDNFAVSQAMSLTSL